MRNKYAERTVTTRAWLLEELLRDFIGDPYDLLAYPRPRGNGYWGDANDQGVTIVNEAHATVAFITWPDLQELVDDLRASRLHSTQQVGTKYKSRIKRYPSPTLLSTPTKGDTHGSGDDR